MQLFQLKKEVFQNFRLNNRKIKHKLLTISENYII